MNTKRLVYIAVFTALTTVSGLISVPIPFTQVEMSLQTVTVLLAGIVLGGRDGALSVLIYMAMGLVGLPVFTKGGGPGYVFMPSFGYLIGFPIGSFLAGALCGRRKKCTRGGAFACMLVGMIPVYAIGIVYQIVILYYYTHTAWAAVIGGVPAVLVLGVKDAVLCGLSATLYPSIRKALHRDVRKNCDKVRDVKHKI